MYQTEQSQIIRYVNTFTVADWEARRPNDRIRKGITRVTKSNSQSADKFAQIKQKQFQLQIIHNENEDYSNRNHAQEIDHTSPQYLLQRIRNLQLELTMLQKQKIELARKLQEKVEQKKPRQNLIESHYITCKQDIEQMMEQKNRMLQTIRNVEDQNNYLKINMHIQQQYIIKVQAELDCFRNKNNQKDVGIDQFVQTEQQLPQIQNIKKLLVEVQTQNDLQNLEEYRYLKDLANQFQHQTNEFALIIENLEQQKNQLIKENDRLNAQLQYTKKHQDSRYEAKIKEQEKQKEFQQKIMLFQKSMSLKIKHYEERLLAQKRFSQEIISNKNREIEELKEKIQTSIKKEQTLKNQVLSKNQSNNKNITDLRESHQMIQKIKMQLHKKEVQIQSLLHSRQKQNLRKNSLEEQLFRVKYEKDQNNGVILKTDLLRYKQQFDELLVYLDQKSDILKEKQILLLQQIERSQKNYSNSEESIKKQIEINNIIANYQSQIKLIKSSLEGYINQLIIQRKNEINQQSKKKDYVNQLQSKIKAQNQSTKLQTKHYQQRLQSQKRLWQQLSRNKNKEIEELKELTKSYTAIEQKLKKELTLMNQSYQQKIVQLRELQQQNQRVNIRLLQVQTQLQDFKYLIKKQRLKASSFEEQLLRMRAEKKQQIQQKQQNLQKEYSRYKHQFDDLLLYLDQKSQALKQKQLLIIHQIQSGQIIYQKNEQTLRKQTEIEALIGHYQSKIKRVQSSLEQYIIQLTNQRKIEKEGQILNLLQKQQMQKSLNQRQKVYLLSKIQNLQRQLFSKSDHQDSILSQKQILIQRLRQQIIQLSTKYQQSASIINELKQQNYFLISKLKEEQLIQLQINNKIQQIKKDYNYQINQMQANINQLQNELQQLQRNSQQIRQSNQLRIIEVKKDYDLLYSKYIKYKTISKLLQEPKQNKKC